MTKARDNSKFGNFAGNEVFLDSDKDTSITADTDDQIDIKVGGNDSISITPSQITITDADSNQPRLLLKNTNADSSPPFLDFQKDSSSPADNDVIGKMRFIGDDDGGNTVAYATIVSTSPDVSDGSENGDLRFETIVDGTNAERMRIDSSGNVGIGTSSPTDNLTVSTSGNTNFMIKSGSSNNGRIHFADDDDTDVGRIIYDHANNNLTFWTNDNERIRIDSSGNVYFGTTGSAPWTATSGTFTRIGDTFPITATAQNSICAIFNRNTGDGAAVEFKKSGTVVGSISVTASNTAYNTSSDYRLKENVNYTFDATTELKRLKPCKFNFIGESETVEGFLAHEVSNVVPLAVTGTKDATKVQDVYDDDGNVTGTETVPDYQGIDQSKLVPLLVKTIQELEARITALENN